MEIRLPICIETYRYNYRIMITIYKSLSHNAKQMRVLWYLFPSKTKGWWLITLIQSIHLWLDHNRCLKLHFNSIHFNGVHSECGIDFLILSLRWWTRDLWLRDRRLPRPIAHLWLSLHFYKLSKRRSERSSAWTVEKA